MMPTIPNPSSRPIAMEPRSFNMSRFAASWIPLRFGPGLEAVTVSVEARGRS